MLAYSAEIGREKHNVPYVTEMKREKKKECVYVCMRYNTNAGKAKY
jgi:hypothetical protein